MHGDGSFMGGLFPQEICYEYMAGKKFYVYEIYMGMLSFAAFSISLITGLLNGIFRMQRTTYFWTFLSLVSQFTNLPHTFVSTLLFPSTILKQQWDLEVDRGFKFSEASFLGI